MEILSVKTQILQEILDLWLIYVICITLIQ